MKTSDIFKAYDIRGTYPDQLNEEVARAVGSAFGTFANAPRIIVARDMRPSGVALVEAFANGARSVGVQVIDLGLASTDFLYRLAQSRPVQRHQTLLGRGRSPRR
jgi:phosphomannomutase